MSVEEHIRALLEGDRRARESAAWSLRGLRFDPGLLAPVLAHPHVSRQVKAIEVLRYSRTREAIELLLPMLASENPLVAGKAVSSLGKIGAVAPDLIAGALDTASAPWHRLYILDVLSRLGHPRGREVLLVQADAWEPSHRAHALHCLRRYRTDPAVDTIRAALGDPETRHTAVDVASRLRDPDFVAPLVELVMTSDDFDTRRAAERALGKYGAAALPALLAHAADPALRDRVARALGDILWRLDEAQLWVLWERPEAAVRDACLETVYQRARWLSAPRVIAAASEHLHDPESRRRCWAIYALGRVEADPDQLRALLEPMRSDLDDYVRNRAEDALRALANRRR